jgi:hypothetical protein
MVIGKHGKDLIADEEGWFAMGEPFFGLRQRYANSPDSH